MGWLNITLVGNTRLRLTYHPYEGDYILPGDAAQFDAVLAYLQYENFSISNSDFNSEEMNHYRARIKKAIHATDPDEGVYGKEYFAEFNSLELYCEFEIHEDPSKPKMIAKIHNIQQKSTVSQSIGSLPEILHPAPDVRVRQIIFSYPRSEKYRWLIVNIREGTQWEMKSYKVKTLRVPFITLVICK